MLCWAGGKLRNTHKLEQHLHVIRTVQAKSSISISQLCGILYFACSEINHFEIHSLHFTVRTTKFYILFKAIYIDLLSMEMEINSN